MFVRPLFLFALLLAILCTAIAGIRLAESAVTPPLVPNISPASAASFRVMLRSTPSSAASFTPTPWPTKTPIHGLMITSTVTAPSGLLHPADEGPWQLYAFREGSFHVLTSSRRIPDLSATPQIFDQSITPSAWHVSASALADVTGDGNAEGVLVVWRPWRDWPIQRWSSARSPIASFHDEAGNSCHLILLDPSDGHEVWAGSALPAPFLALAVGDVDGDKQLEIVMLEGDYVTGRQGPARHVDVWRWNGFGFTLQWRSPSGIFRQLYLVDADDDRVLDIAVR